MALTGFLCRPPPHRPQPPSDSSRPMVGSSWRRRSSRAGPTRPSSRAPSRQLRDNARRGAPQLGVAYVPALIPRKRDVIARHVCRRARATHAENCRRGCATWTRSSCWICLQCCATRPRHGAPYHRTDADWNDRGAFFVARALLKEAHKHEAGAAPACTRRSVPACSRRLPGRTCRRAAAATLVGETGLQRRSRSRPSAAW